MLQGFLKRWESPVKQSGHCDISACILPKVIYPHSVSDRGHRDFPLAELFIVKSDAGIE